MTIEMTAILISIVGLVLLIWKRRPLTAFVFGLGLGMFVAVEWVNLLLYKVGLY